MNHDNLKRYIRLVIEEYLKETSTTAGASGYNTPHAFRGNKEKYKKKIRRIASLLGMKIVEPLPSSDPIGSSEGPSGTSESK